MSEIKTSAKGIDYAKPYVLKTKSRVYSQAMLMSIPHKHSKKIDVSLKIGRYTLPSFLCCYMPRNFLLHKNDFNIVRQAIQQRFFIQFIIILI